MIRTILGTDVACVSSSRTRMVPDCPVCRTFSTDRRLRCELFQEGPRGLTHAIPGPWLAGRVRALRAKGVSDPVDAFVAAAREFAWGCELEKAHEEISA